MTKWPHHLHSQSKNRSNKGFYMNWIECFVKISCIFPVIFGTFKCFTQIFQNLWAYPSVNVCWFFFNVFRIEIYYSGTLEEKKIQTNQINPIIIVKRCKNCLLFIHPLCVCLTTLEMSKCQKTVKTLQSQTNQKSGVLKLNAIWCEN